ncbi:MAG: TonB-dependent receptor [Gemmatimonadaceae bacterium]|jgi:iron complex outermembrane receptor protein|nr:TonB-dependent receptor [Gemmatimonadaceae bacterium]
MSSLVRPLALLLAVLVAVPTRARAQVPPDRHIHGVVEDAATRRAIRDADVFVETRGEATAQPVVVRTRSDADGRFDVRHLHTPTVRLYVRAIGYAPSDRIVDLRDDDVVVAVRLVPAPTVLAAVTVTADTLADRLARVAAVSALDARTIAATRGQTLGETIRQLPGVATIQFGPSISKPVIRGLNSQRVLVMNSGLRQEDQQWGTEHAPNIDGFDADAVTVVRGAATVLYGPDALGGVVRVDRAAVPDSGAMGGDIATNLFSNSRQGALSIGVRGANLALPALGRVGYRLRLTSRIAGNGQAPDYFLSNTGFRELNGSAALGVSRAWGRGELLVSRFATELGVLRQAHAGNFDDLQRALTAAPRDSAFSYGIGRPNQRVAHTTARLRVVRDLAAGQQLEFVYGFQFNDRREYDNHGPLRFRNVPAFHLRLFTHSLDARWSHAPRLGWRGTVGTSALAQGNQTIGKAFLIPGYDLWQGALYAQEEFTRGRLSLTAGARTDVLSQTTLAFADLGITSPAGTRRWTGFSGSFGGAWALTRDLDIALRVARAWRPPTVNERYAQGVHHGTAQYELGDAALTPERSLGLEGTVRYRGARLVLDAAAYSNGIDGFIFLRPTDPVLTIRGAFPGFRWSQTDARLRGVELAGSYQLLDRLQATVNGTLVRGTDRTTGAPLFDMPADRVTIGLRTTGSSARLGRWYAGAGTLLVRRQDRVPTGTIYALPTAGYGLLALDIGTGGLALAGRRIDLSLSINNALDHRYRDYLSRYRLFVNDPGRDVVLRVTTPF